MDTCWFYSTNLILSLQSWILRRTVGVNSVSWSIGETGLVSRLSVQRRHSLSSFRRTSHELGRWQGAFMADHFNIVKCEHNCRLEPSGVTCDETERTLGPEVELQTVGALLAIRSGAS